MVRRIGGYTAEEIIMMARYKERVAKFLCRKVDCPYHRPIPLKDKADKKKSQKGYDDFVRPAEAEALRVKEQRRHVKKLSVEERKRKEERRKNTHLQKIEKEYDDFVHLPEAEKLSVNLELFGRKLPVREESTVKTGEGDKYLRKGKKGNYYAVYYPKLEKLTLNESSVKEKRTVETGRENKYLNKFEKGYDYAVHYPQLEELTLNESDVKEKRTVETGEENKYLNKFEKGYDYVVYYPQLEELTLNESGVKEKRTVETGEENKYLNKFEPSHYDDMSWSPSGSHFRSPGASPENYRRRIHTEDDFPSTTKGVEDKFFSGRRSPSFPRRIFKKVGSDSPFNQRFNERSRIFNQFNPNQWEEEFRNGVPKLRREFDRNFDGPSPRKFDDEFQRHFPRDLKKDIEEEFEKSEGKVHHIPIMVERRKEDLKKSKFGNHSPPPEKTHDEEYANDRDIPRVHRSRKPYEKDDSFPSRHFQNRVPGTDLGYKARTFTNNIPDTWDPQAVHTLPTRRGHKASQSFDDSRHTVPPKHVYRSYSETHEDKPKPQQQQHSAAFRSHSDGHCPNQTYVTKIEVNMPTKTDEQSPSTNVNQSNLRSHCDQRKRIDEDDSLPESQSGEFVQNETTLKSSPEVSNEPEKPSRTKRKNSNPALQQIAVVLQNVEDLVVRVDSYTGCGRDKQYRFLDEMLTRCMLRLDDVDTEGREDIRLARKAAVRDVQDCIDKLEAKAEESERLQRPDVIPLGDVPRDEEPLKEQSNDNEEKALPEQQKENSTEEKRENENGEQTKL